MEEISKDRNTHASTPGVSPSRKLLHRALALGPGLVFILSTVGPSDLVTNSIAGSTYGCSLLWLVAAALLARFLLVDATARYVMVSGESLLAGFGRISRWIVYLWFIVAMLKRHLSGLLKLVLLGTASHIVLPLPTPHSAEIWGLFWWVGGFVLMFWGRYGVIEKLSKPIAILMGASLAAAALMSRPDPVEIMTGILRPVIPTEPGLYSPIVVLMTVMSTTASFSNLRYSAFVHEKGWRTTSYLKQQRTDLLMSMAGVFLMLTMIQVAAAGSLMPRGIQVGELEDLIPIFSEVLGHGGRIVFGVTLWTLVFSSYLGSTTGNGIMISDVYYRFIRRNPEIADRNQAAGQMPAYRWLVLWVFVSPLYIFFFADWTPVWLLLFRDATSLLSLPLITLAVLRLTTDRKIMGGYANGWFTNVVLALTTVAAVYLGYQGAIELLR